MTMPHRMMTVQHGPHVIVLDSMVVISVMYLFPTRVCAKSPSEEQSVMYVTQMPLDPAVLNNVSGIRLVINGAAVLAMDHVNVKRASLESYATSAPMEHLLMIVRQIASGIAPAAVMAGAMQTALACVSETMPDRHATSVHRMYLATRATLPVWIQLVVDMGDAEIRACANAMTDLLVHSASPVHLVTLHMKATVYGRRSGIVLLKRHVVVLDDAKKMGSASASRSSIVVSYFPTFKWM
jgi:hypothetical protein